jgi:Protein of unknown function (DUF2971)
MTLRRPSDLGNDETVTALVESIPPVLYKYSGLSEDRFDWMRRLIVDSELYFVPPSAFNDPLDCRIPPSYNASALTIEQFWREVFKRNYPSQNLRDHKEAIRKILMDSKTLHGQKKLTEQLFKSLDRHGMVCLARDPKSMLLWSYYAQGHRGIAVRFNMSRTHLAAIPKHFPVEVQYANDFPAINYYKSTTHQFLKSILGTKSNAWKHEEEWRLVLVEGSGYVHIPPSMVDGIILGMRIDPVCEQNIRSWVGTRSPAIELLRVITRSNSFELDLVPA